MEAYQRNIGLDPTAYLSEIKSALSVFKTVVLLKLNSPYLLRIFFVLSKSIREIIIAGSIHKVKTGSVFTLLTNTTVVSSIVSAGYLVKCIANIVESRIKY